MEKFSRHENPFEEKYGKNSLELRRFGELAVENPV